MRTSSAREAFPFLNDRGVRPGADTDLSGDKIAMEFFEAVLVCCQIKDKTLLSESAAPEPSGVISGYTKRFELRSSTRLVSCQ